MASNLSDANEVLKNVYAESAPAAWERLSENIRNLIDASSRKGHAVKVEHEPRWLIDRERFRRQYEALTAEGYERGYLELDEESGEPVITKNLDYSVWEWDETEEEFQARKNKAEPLRIHMPTDPTPIEDYDL